MSSTIIRGICNAPDSRVAAVFMRTRGWLFVVADSMKTTSGLTVSCSVLSWIGEWQYRFSYMPCSITCTRGVLVPRLLYDQKILYHRDTKLGKN